MIKKLVWILVVAIVIAAGIWLWANHYFLSPSATHTNTSSATSTQTQATSTASLGAQIYAKTANPINSVSSAASSTVPNPVQGLYKNPFQ